MLLATIIGLNIYSTYGDVVITNGKVVLGVNEYADLNVPYEQVASCPASDPLPIGQIGLRNADCQFASTEPGCQCEGWGVGVRNLNIQFGANQDRSRGPGGLFNIVADPLIGTTGGSTATSVTRDTITGEVEVKHEFGTSASEYAMKVLVTITNIGSRAFDSTIYRRAMDWDIYPTPFSEYVTIGGTGPARSSGILIHSSDNGFCFNDVLTTPDCGYRRAECDDQDCTDSGPSDHGAQFDFDLGPLAAGDSVSFNIFYGTAPGEVKALQALADIGAEVYSLGQNNRDPSGGLPWTFFFGFSGVGGEVIGMSLCTQFLYRYILALTINKSIC